MRAAIHVLPGDGVGPEVTAGALRVLRAVAETGGHTFLFTESLVGGAALDACGTPLPEETLRACRAADAILLGAVGGPRWSDNGAQVRPEQGLLALRKELGLFANLRPVRAASHRPGRSPLVPERLCGVDILFVRELTGGLYFGEKRRADGRAVDECAYTIREVERIVRIAAEFARARRCKLTSVDKANVLETSRLWRETATRVVRAEFPELELEHVLVDAMAVHLLTRPADFDVVVTENLFGDILTDEASVLAGSLGLLPSASLGSDAPGLYEPVHGSAPDLAGRGIANPFGAILSAALLLRHSLDLEEEAGRIESAVAAAQDAGIVTRDLAHPGVSTAEATDAVLCYLQGSVALSRSARIGAHSLREPVRGEQRWSSADRSIGAGPR